MFIRFDVIHERDGRTDGRTLRDSKDRVCIASRDKMDSHFHCYAGLIELLFKPSYFFCILRCNSVAIFLPTTIILFTWRKRACTCSCWILTAVMGDCDHTRNKSR